MNKWAKRGIALIFVVDFLAALVLYQQAIIARETIAKPPKPQSVQTFGKLAVQSHWKGGDDVDLYVMDPSGNIVYFSSLSAGAMHLEHDDLGDSTGTDLEGVNESERVVLRGTEPGEYVVNVQMYGKVETTQTEVTIVLFQLQGDDKELKRVKILLGDSGSEQTAFRFRVDADGRVTNINQLPRRIVCLVNQDDTTACP